MQVMKFTLSVVGLLLAFVSGGAQRVVDITHADADVIGQERINGLVGGQVLSPVKFVKVTEGTPFFSDEWLDGTLVLSGGKVLDHIELRIDLLQHEVHYKGANGQEMIATTPIRAVTLAGATGPLTFVPGTPWRETDKALDGAWLQVLVNDKVSLLREIRKKMAENTPYGSSTIERTIAEADFYYLQMNGHFLRIESWSHLPELFGDKQQALVDYIRVNHLKGRKPEEYAQVVSYYNTLTGSQKITKG
jgi:hypothetical protein